jgi:hypothetical protein
LGGFLFLVPFHAWEENHQQEMDSADKGLEGGV